VEITSTAARKMLQGTAGYIVRAIDPYTEAHFVAVLLHLLTAFGNLIGATPHFRVEHTKHPLRLFVVLVGRTAKSRKGQAWSALNHLLSHVAKRWARERVIHGGLSSGEGLLYFVRDPVVQTVPTRKDSKKHRKVVKDPGVMDKRLLVIAEELSQGLKMMSREGNILSDVLRQAWDSGDFKPLTKNNPITVTDAHLSLIGHITRDELVRQIKQVEQANGFANRFIWAEVERSKSLPSPTGLPRPVPHPISWTPSETR